ARRKEFFARSLYEPVLEILSRDIGYEKNDILLAYCNLSKAYGRKLCSAYNTPYPEIKSRRNKISKMSKTLVEFYRKKDNDRRDYEIRIFNPPETLDNSIAQKAQTFSIEK